MPLDPSSDTLVTAFTNLPEFTHGRVRDIRIRWALEEMGRSYRVDLFDGMAERPASYRQWQPFGQVPAFADSTVRLFESGAILLYLGEQDERLLPRPAQERADTTAWLIAALNSVEPALMQIATLDFFQADQPWAAQARPSAVEFAKSRLGRVSEALDGKEWLTGRFSIADIMMVTVLRNISHTDIVGGFPNLSAYQARGEQRPAFQQALIDQAKGFSLPATAETEPI